MNILEIRKRINYLQECAKEEGSIIKEGSLNSFLSFIELTCPLILPQISLTPNNEIYATWRKDRIYSLLFYENGMIKYITI